MQTGVERFSRLLIIATACFCFLCSGFLVSAEVSLVENPPFKTVSSRTRNQETKKQVATKGSLNERFQFSGYFDSGKYVRFSLKEQKTSKPYWLKVGDVVEDGIKVVAFDPEKVGVVLSQGGKEEMLLLKEAISSGSKKYIPKQMYNPVPQKPTTYPTPPASLPKPNELIEKLRREKARKNSNKNQK